MNTHKHARLSFAHQLEMVKQMTIHGLGATQAALAQGVTAQTTRKWLGRYLSGGEAALADASSRPARSPRAIDESNALLIVELRWRRMLQSRIASYVGVSASTVSHRNMADVFPLPISPFLRRFSIRYQAAYLQHFALVQEVQTHQ